MPALLILLLLGSLLCLRPEPAWGQGVPLEQALETLARTAGADLVFASSLVAGKRTTCTMGTATRLEDFLRCALDGTGLAFVRSPSGAYVLTRAAASESGGSLNGRVVDGETGGPLPYASVLLADASTGTTTNEDGRFGFPEVPAGPHRVYVSYLGYAPAVDSVWIEPGASRHVRVALHPERFVLAPVVVDGFARSPEPGAPGMSRLVPYAENGTAPPDLLRRAATLPGVASAGASADLHLQGGAAGEHLVLLDGFPVRNPISAGRFHGAFSPLALGALTVHKAGFGVEHGSLLSGVVHATHDLGGPDAYGPAASLDPISLNGRVTGRWSEAGGGEGVALAAVRTSLWGVYRDAGLRELLARAGPGPRFPPGRAGEPSLAFADVHAAARWQIRPAHVVQASLYRGSNAFTAGAARQAGAGHRAGFPQHAYAWGNLGGQVRYSRVLGPQAVATLQVRGSRYTTQMAGTGPAREGGGGIEKPAPTRPLVQSRLREAGPYPAYHALAERSVLAEVSRLLGPGRRLEAGLEAERTTGVLLAGPAFGTLFTNEFAAWTAGGYLKADFRLGGGAVLEPGLRLTWPAPRRTVYAEPRLALRYDGLRRTPGRLSLRLAGGLYRQFTNRFALGGADPAAPLLFWLPVSPDLAPPRAYHLAAGAALTPTSRWAVDLEAYYKAQPRLLVADEAGLAGAASGAALDPLSQRAFIQAVRGQAYGGSVQVRRAGRRLDWGLTYTYSRAVHRYTDRFENRPVPAPWNEPHRLLMTADAALSRSLSLNLAWAGSRGRTVYAGGGPDGESSLYPLPAYEALDLGLSFEQAWGPRTIHVRAAVLNVLDRRNVYDRMSLPGPSVFLDRLLPGRHLTFSIRLSGAQ